MPKDTHTEAQAATRMSHAEVRSLAHKALSILASSGRGASVPVEDRLDLLCDAFLSQDGDDYHDLLDRMRADGIETTQLVDHVIPATARLMGQRWADDKISFVHVTVGASRLQEAVRALTARPRMQNGRETERDVLLIVPRPEHHTLGAFVAADQFRRLGYRVEIAVDTQVTEIADLLRKRRFALVGLTAAGRRTLASTKDLVDIIRNTVTRVTPIVIGGSVLTSDLDVLALTGADHLAHDARTALTKCGLSMAETGAPRKVTADHVD